MATLNITLNIETHFVEIFAIIYASQIAPLQNRPHQYLPH
jgi:hypothetical protein